MEAKSLCYQALKQMPMKGFFAYTLKLLIVVEIHLSTIENAVFVPKKILEEYPFIGPNRMQRFVTEELVKFPGIDSQKIELLRNTYKQ